MRHKDRCQGQCINWSYSWKLVSLLKIGLTPENWSHSWKRTPFNSRSAKRLLFAARSDPIGFWCCSKLLLSPSNLESGWTSPWLPWSAYTQFLEVAIRLFCNWLGRGTHCGQDIIVASALLWPAAAALGRSHLLGVLGHILRGGAEHSNHWGHFRSPLRSSV